LFERYDGLINELEETTELLKDEADKEMVSLLNEDMIRLNGDEENYGEIEEL
jgi:hypothetical protein